MYDDYRIMQQTIDRAVALELHKGRFRRAIRRSLLRLHHSIDLPERNASDHLTAFAIRYIQVVPRWLRQLEQLCEAAGLDFTPVREFAGQSFAAAPERHPKQVGLATLLDGAYLAHRTLEEINEQLQPACGMPLLPMDSMVANLVVRELLGERLAIALDRICIRIGRRFAGQPLAPDRIVAMILCRQRFIENPGAWPDFAAQLDIGLRVPAMEFDTDTLH